jgi:predicted O-methyltransferase YrrM
MFPSEIQRVMDRVDGLRHQVDDHWQIPRDEAQVLAQLVRLGRCVSICEIGVSYGYSTLHLAAATKPMGGHVDAFDINPKKIDAATKHLTDAGLIDAVTLHLGDARALLGSFMPRRPFDCVFLDADKSQSSEYFHTVRPLLAQRCAIITDNTLTHANELVSFRDLLRAQPGASSVQVAVGNGFELTLLGVR